MRTTAITPHITVAIGQQVRLYHAYIATAPATHNAPSTMTLYKSTVTDLAGFAIDLDGLDAFRSRTSARLVLIDALELAARALRGGRPPAHDTRRPWGWVGVLRPDGL